MGRKETSEAIRKMIQKNLMKISLHTNRKANTKFIPKIVFSNSVGTFYRNGQIVLLFLLQQVTMTIASANEFV